MNIADFGISTYVVITVICYLVCEGVKATNIKGNWLPVIAGAVGGVLGVVACFIVPEFPAHDILSALATGIVSGLAATGCNQVYKQLVEKKEELK